MRHSTFPGSELRERRESMGLSTKEAFEHTLVRIDYIEAFERGDLEALPGACYSAGFLKSYCALLDVDPNRYLDSFRAHSRYSSSRFLRRKGNGKLNLPRWARAWLAWAPVLALLAFGWVTYHLVLQPQPPQDVEASTVQMNVAPVRHGEDF